MLRKSIGSLGLIKKLRPVFKTRVTPAAAISATTTG